MTTVKDLILALQKFPMDAPVFIYDEIGECDGMVDQVTYEGPYEEVDILGGEEYTYRYSPYGCNGDSEVERYWSERGTDAPVVFIQSTNTFHDFTIK